MYIHEEKKVGYIAHMRTASRSTAKVLEDRGFTRIGAHHSRPSTVFLQGPQNGNEHDWFLQDISEYTWYAGVRHPVEWWHSYLYMHRWITAPWQIQKMKPNDMVTLLWNHREFMGSGARLFPAMWEIENCTALHYERIHNALEDMLSAHDLPGLDGDFLHVDSKFTANKPRLDARRFFNEEALEWIDLTFREEFVRFGYAWPSSPLP